MGRASALPILFFAPAFISDTMKISYDYNLSACRPCVYGYG
jgi:hypothetical protein